MSTNRVWSYFKSWVPHQVLRSSMDLYISQLSCGVAVLVLVHVLGCLGWSVGRVLGFYPILCVEVKIRS